MKKKKDGGTGTLQRLNGVVFSPGAAQSCSQGPRVFLRPFLVLLCELCKLQLKHYVNIPSESIGLTESVIAAACSRVGQSVLHLDRRNYYAGNWASFTFNGLLSWIEEYKNQQEAQITESEQVWRSLIDEGEDVVPLSSVDSSISNLEVFCYASEEEEKEETKTQLTSCQPVNAETESEETNEDSTEAQDTVTGDDATESNAKTQNEEHEEQQTSEISEPSQSQEEKEPQPISSPADPPVEVEKKITYQKLLKEGRRFNIDLVSKLMYSRGALVDLLIKSNVSRYAEFKNIGRILTCRNGKVEQVPCSRADVFASKQLTVVEKRMLMKFLTFCLDFEQHPEEYQDYSEKPFSEFLKNKKLTENLQDFVLHSIAMVTQQTITEEGLKATQHFLRCLGRYGNTPFLFPLYGLGEIPQCFCRATLDPDAAVVSQPHSLLSSPLVCRRWLVKVCGACIYAGFAEDRFKGTKGALLSTLQSVKMLNGTAYGLVDSASTRNLSPRDRKST
ncbi:Rab proteins geranylgeranyltransferase component A 1 [Anabarilius grahami]|uniref:Rab proteins geranylgeranyltransferase component A 1 n=1 Tax=Anabarilius grahami TaxID=495550 RepID=A0A3N0XUV4_ANAGA|nr:Rab proteins geranylgeranyltransferase component A 1 [Anabarilius grahami]